ncbi:MAG: hypothetical protein H8D45_09455 [Bacteroidetes bacterium]|nr:hypothetical protein [Bacteroidota bacterium]MBL7102732.1 hypothetical protein [Bacteroidales bacterium]
MKTITLDRAIANLPEIIATTINNQEETIIATENGAVVMIDQENWEGMIETLRLLNDKKSLSALLEGHKKRMENKVKGKTTDQVFHDL